MLKHQVSKSEFKARALEFFRHIESTGEPLIVTDHGKPTLVIRPYSAETANPLAVLRDSVVRYGDPLAPVDDDAWEASR